MSSPAEHETSESTHPILASLQDKSASPQHLFQALTAVEKGLPHLLLCLKPILAQLGSSPNEALRRKGTGRDGAGSGSGPDGGLEEGTTGEEGEEAKRAVVDFLAILDEIQDTLRQSTLVLRTLKASPSTLIPPPPNSIPTPFASTLPRTVTNTLTPSAGSESLSQSMKTEAELGLYASRIEARTLGEVRDLLRDWSVAGREERMVLDS